MRGGKIAALVVIAGCTSQYGARPDTIQIREPRNVSAPAGPRVPHEDENTRRAALARGPVPGYAGEMIQGCDFVVLLTDTLHQAPAARKHAGNIPVTCSRPGKLLFRQVKYDFAQLYDWYSGPFMVVWRQKGVTSSSIAIQHNRIEVGVMPEARARVQRLLDSLPIPKDAVAMVRGMYACAGTGGPSVVVNVRDPQGLPAARGTTIVIQDGTFKDSVSGTQPLSDLKVGAGQRRPGIYQVRLYKSGYRLVVLDDVKAPGDTICRYATPSDVRDVTLEPLPR